jgi:predicted Zn-ribbon and HTH transcriptional regulator
MGAIYSFPLKCDACGAQYKEEIDISKELKTKEMSSSVKEPIELKLPNSGEIITYRFLRGRDENSISKSAKRMLMQSSDPSDPSFIMRIATMIQAVGDKTDLDYYAKEQYVSGLDAGDINEISNDVEEKESGISLMVNTECRKCGYLDEVMMPFTAEFFRPRKRQ